MTKDQPILLNTIDSRIKELANMRMSIRQIGKEVNLSYTAVRHRLAKLAITTDYQPKFAQSTCQVCMTQLKGRQTHYCSKMCSRSKHGANSYRTQQQRATDRKQDLVERLGGACVVCGYNRNTAALCFHHQDPRLKELPLDARSLGNNSIKRILAELTKCVLLCSNCHMELHHPQCSGI